MSDELTQVLPICTCGRLGELDSDELDALAATVNNPVLAPVFKDNLRRVISQCPKCGDGLNSSRSVQTDV